jgi:hypothetical protein
MHSHIRLHGVAQGKLHFIAHFSYMVYLFYLAIRSAHSDYFVNCINGDAVLGKSFSRRWLWGRDAV